MNKANYNPAEHPKNLTDRAFRIGLIVKGIHGFLETVLGISFLIVRPDEISRLADTLTHGELSQDPHDFIANHILKAADNITAASLTFAAIYLLAHGLVKLVLVIEVIRDHLWAYIALIVVTGLFVIYQIYRLAAVHFSLSLVLLTIIDLVIIYLTAVEYRKQRVRLARSTNHES